MTNRVGAKGQVVIDKEIRDRLGIQPGWLAMQQVVEGHVELYFVPAAHRRSLKGSLARYTTVRLPDQEALDRAAEESWAMAAAEEDASLVTRLRAQ